jgi:steroid delta-isomerase-like uncharacterized protein
MDPKEVVEKFIAAWNGDDTDTAAGLLDPGFVYSSPGLVNQGVESLDKEGMLKRAWAMTKATFPDCYVEITNIVNEGDQVIVEEIETGTMKNPVVMLTGTIPATNRSYRVRYAFFFKVNAKGLITAMRVYTDTWQFMSQLGIPAETMFPRP